MVLPGFFSRLVCGTLICTALGACAPLVSVREVRPPPPAAATGRAREELAAGRRRERERDVPDALGTYLLAGERAERALRAGDHTPATAAAYDDAAARVASLISRERLTGVFQADGVMVPAPDGRPFRLRARWDRPPPDRPDQFDFVPSDEVQVSGTAFTRRVEVPGLGAPGVAIGEGKPAAEARADFASAGKTYTTVTALLRFQGDRQATLTFQDPLARERASLAPGHDAPLAADYTTSVALVLAREKPQRLGLIRLLRPERYADTTQLIRLQPYDPARIPVLVVHGLQDTPATWVPMLNALRADPEIRRRYQFWIFSYTSGNPFPYSAVQLRAELDRAHARYPDHPPMVLIGHSMGGLVSRLLVTDSGLALWNTFFARPPQATRLPGEDRRLLERVLIFAPRSDVSRVVFISTPHRGSDLAATWIGRTASRLVQLPQTLVRVGAATLGAMSVDQDGQKLRRVPNSIDNLSPKDPFLRTLDTLPIRAGVPYHSIMGDRGRGDTPDSSDGVVPYRSSHLAGAQSERIVPSGHPAHQNPEAIAEVRRILHAHLRDGVPTEP